MLLLIIWGAAFVGVGIVGVLIFLPIFLCIAPVPIVPASIFGD